MRRRTNRCLVGDAHNEYSTISGGGGTTPTYDNNGNTTKDDQGLVYGFDPWNRIVTVTNQRMVEYRYYSVIWLRYPRAYVRTKSEPLLCKRTESV